MHPLLERLIQGEWLYINIKRECSNYTDNTILKLYKFLENSPLCKLDKKVDLPNLKSGSRYKYLYLYYSPKIGLHSMLVGNEHMPPNDKKFHLLSINELLSITDKDFKQFELNRMLRNE